MCRGSQQIKINVTRLFNSTRVPLSGAWRSSSRARGTRFQDLFSASLFAANTALYNTAFDSYDRVTRFSIPVVRTVRFPHERWTFSCAREPHTCVRACVNACARQRILGSKQIFKITVPNSEYLLRNAPTTHRRARFIKVGRANTLKRTASVYRRGEICMVVTRRNTRVRIESIYRLIPEITVSPRSFEAGSSRCLRPGSSLFHTYKLFDF